MKKKDEDENPAAQAGDNTPEVQEFIQRTEKRLFSAVRESLDKWEKENPNFLSLGLFRYLEHSLSSLRHYIEDPEEKGITWKTPAAELRYPVPPILLTVTRDELLPGIAPELAEKVGEAFVMGRNLRFLEWITGYLVNYVEKGEVFSTILEREDTVRLLEAIAGLPEKEQGREIERWFKSVTREMKKLRLLPASLGPLTVTVTDEKTGKKTKGTVTLNLIFQPLVVDLDAEEAYYPVQVELRLRRLKPETWSEEDRAKFWKILSELVEAATPEEKLPEFADEEGGEPAAAQVPEAPLPVPEVRPKADKLARSIRSPIHLEGQKFGGAPPVQGSLFDALELASSVRSDVEEHAVTIVGIDPTVAQGHALHAVQALLESTDYRGNLKDRGLTLSREDKNSFSFSGYLPALRFSVTQYLEAYGLTKKDRGRGLEFLPNERAEALGALRELSEKRFLLFYERRYWRDKKELFDVVRTVRPLLDIIEGWEALTRGERNAVTAGGNTEGTDEKLRVLAIQPSPILVDQVEGYHVLKPANYRQEIRLLVPKSSRFVYNFADFLMLEAERKRRAERKSTEAHPDLIRYTEKTLAHKLRMDAWVKNRQWKQIRGSLKKCCETAQALGYITSYAFETGTSEDVVELRLNLEKFRRAAEAQDVKALPAPTVTLPTA